jgi:hypothetical protein
MDFIWRAKSLLIHEGKQPSSSAAIFQISNTFNHHINAWRDLALPTVWTPLVAGWIKWNFDVVVSGSFAVAAAVLSDENGTIFATATQKLVYTDVLQGEAHAALLVVCLAASMGLGPISVERDALLVILAINSHALFSSWSFTNCIFYISLTLSFFQSWNALKMSRFANFMTHVLAKWTHFNRDFGSILTKSLIISSIRIKMRKIIPVTFFPHSIRKKKKNF